MIENTLQDTGLYSDSITTEFSEDMTLCSYYGFNVTKIDKEPIDQIHAFIVARRIQEDNLQRYGEKGAFFPFVAGVYEVLNQDTIQKIHETLKRKRRQEQYKKTLFEKIMSGYGIEGNVFLTQDFWTQEEYWDCFQFLFEDGVFNKDDLINDVIQIVYKDVSREEAVELINRMPKLRDLSEGIMLLDNELLLKIGDWPANICYTPAEVAEALFLRDIWNVNLKIGPPKERTYDRRIAQFMDILHLKQPTALNSKRLEPITATPYIAKKGKKIRIFFEDTAERIRERIKDVPVEEYVLTIDDFCGTVFNPFVEKMIYAVESARSLGMAPVVIDDREVSSGRDVINYVRDGGRVRTLKENLPEFCESYLIEPFK